MDEAVAYLKWLKERAKSLVWARWKEIRHLAKELRKHRSLTGAECEKSMQEAPDLTAHEWDWLSRLSALSEPDD